MNRLLESLFFLLQNYFVFIFFYVRTFVTYAQNHSRVAAWPDWKRTERKNKEYVVANEISLTLFPTLQGDSPWPNETILSGVPARHNFLFLFSRATRMKFHNPTRKSDSLLRVESFHCSWKAPEKCRSLFFIRQSIPVWSILISISSEEFYSPLLLFLTN